jgi:small subunit ribosomal protein S16
MSVKIRLSRGGAKKRPYYYIVVAHGTSPRDGKYIEQIGTFNPMLPKDSAERVKLDVERAKYWMSVGAQPSDRVARFLDKSGLMKRVRRSTQRKLSRRRSALSAKPPKPRRRPTSPPPRPKKPPLQPRKLAFDTPKEVILGLVPRTHRASWLMSASEQVDAASPHFSHYAR